MLRFGALAFIDSSHQKDASVWVVHIEFAQTHFDLSVVVHLKQLITKVIYIGKILEPINLFRVHSNLPNDLAISRDNHALWEELGRIRLNERIISNR
jgi:hypothetical protein